MIRQVLFFSAILFLIIQATGCVNDKREAVEPGILLCDTTLATFDEVVLPIIHNNCAKSGCHDGVSGNVRFLTYTDLSPFLLDGSIKKRINASENSPMFMPDDGPMDPCDLKKINEWLDMGFPDN